MEAETLRLKKDFSEKEAALNTQILRLRESEMKICEESARHEKDLALVRHHLKESQRKIDNEMEQRKKTEAHLIELKRKFDDEQNRWKKEMNSNHQQNDKVHSLEKQLLEIQDKLKTETESIQR